MDEVKIVAMREGGKILGNLLRDLKNYVKPGMTGVGVDAWVRAEILKRGAGVAYDMLETRFPGAICISVNDELVHGVPTDEPFQIGDKVSFDLDIFYKGYFTDSAFTMIVGGEKTASSAVRRQLSVTESAMWEGIEKVKAGVHLGDVGYAVQKVLEKGKLGVITDYIGHGIGKTMHEEPDVPNYGRKGHGYILKEGDTICIEPMSSLGKPRTKVDSDNGWTVRMRDGSTGAHFEHTVLVLRDGYEVLTLAD